MFFFFKRPVLLTCLSFGFQQFWVGGEGGGGGFESLSLSCRYFLLDKEMVTFWSPETT